MSNPHILPRPQTSDSGFTLLEMLVAIVIMTIFVSILYPVFTQALHTSQESETQARLQELVKGVKVAYEKDAMVVDTTGANGALVFTSDWSQVLGNPNNGTALLTDGSETVTPTQAYPPGRPQDIGSSSFQVGSLRSSLPRIR
ncbi:prepilin-type N-terminal cleavage/methylation domain-containing protein [Acidithiobacillus caldus]|uniref:prepilin-type N-terminal cleavage/methylation domain-containing protein n=1 Tax=Acidithiobacillus caldus TaxID=33059 RepID=UPI0005A1C7C9|nr:prepilin-type N-terminal cleavage/methylation domain-containing protein [Acidithiobacillus caldus]